MHKWVNIAISVGISAFLAVNLYLLFSDKSIIPKSVYVDRYERMTSADHRLDIAKEGLIAPEETYTVYVGNEETIDSWLVKEGEQVDVGDEIATLQTERAEGQRSIWETEEEALRQQQSDLKQTLSSLQSERQKAKSSSSSNVNRSDNASKSTDDDTKVEVGLNVDVQVDVKQEGAFAQGIASAEQDLADIERQLTVIQAQLAQDESKPALVSPVEGTVSKITRRGNTLAVDIFSTQQVIVTYAINNEWKLIESGDRAIVQGDGIEERLEGTVVSVSQIPAEHTKWLDAYKALDDKTVKNPLAYYEVRILTDADMHMAPFGNDTNAVITVDEALDTISMKEHWLDDRHTGTATAWRLDGDGRATSSQIVTPFVTETRAVVTEGLQLGDVVIFEPGLQKYKYAPKVFLPLKVDTFPAKGDWRTFGLKNYAKYMFIK